MITVPKYLEAAVKKHEKDAREEIDEVLREREMRGDRTIPVIVSRGGDRKLVHYLGQKYRIDRRSREPKVPLLSHGWNRGMKHENEEIIFRAYEGRNHLPSVEGRSQLSSMQGRNQLSSMQGRNRLPSLSDDVVTFDQLPLDKNIIATLKEEGYIEPSHVQVKAIGEILTSKNVMISSEAGSGKTLAYGIPLLHSVLRLKKSGNRSGDPLAMVILPTRELAEQIGKVLTKLAQVVGVGVATMIGGAPKHISHTGYDIIVTTAGLIHHHTRQRG